MFYSGWLLRIFINMEFQQSYVLTMTIVLPQHPVSFSILLQEPGPFCMPTSKHDQEYKICNLYYYLLGARIKRKFVAMIFFILIHDLKVNRMYHFDIISNLRLTWLIAKNCIPLSTISYSRCFIFGTILPRKISLRAVLCEAAAKEWH